MKNGKGDICGRYAWAQGPIGTDNKQYYPRDFSLFALGGNVTGFPDVAGPVAAAGNVTASGFSLSGGRQEQIALLATGTVDFTSGTVYGAIIYGTTYNNHGQTVTLVNPSDPNAPPVLPAKTDFTALKSFFTKAATRLADMSGQVNLYSPATTATKANQTVTFTGPNLDQELNVFSLDSGLLTGTTSFVFNVPQGSFVIINVGGTNPAFMNAGFMGPAGGSLPTSPSRILWNFPGATTLTVQSVGFQGSILAPSAAATIKYGCLYGTAVVKSAIVNSELYMTRYQVPGTRGCLGLDSSWSCSNDTVLDYAPAPAPPTAPILASEAGFLEIDGGSYTAENKPRTSPTHRIWYSFQPAWYTPKSKPLAVLFNGGPGSSTSAMMFSFNTGPMTLDPEPAVTHDQKITSNPNSWTRFANLLYIDAPGTGFSYPLPYGTGPQDLGTDMDRDAGLFLRVVVRFLTRHPALLDNRVVLVGESYGGTRATLMLEYLLGHESVVPGSGAAYQDAQLSSELGNYFQTVFGPLTATKSRILTRFGHQVLIQPGLVGQQQQDQRQDWMVVGCEDPIQLPDHTVPCYFAGEDPNTHEVIHPTCDRYDCDKLNAKQTDNQEWIFYRVKQAGESLGDLATLKRALDVDVTTIRWMKASERVGAWGRGNGLTSDDMRTTFGRLPDGDTYFVPQDAESGVPYAPGTPDQSRRWYEAGASIGAGFLNNVLDGVVTFIPIAVKDSVIRPPSISYALNAGAYDTDHNGLFNSIVSHVDLNLTSPAYLPRPGGMSITYRSGVTKTVVMPNAYDAGHTIVMRAQPAAELLADIMQWYKKSLE
jgi:choice-of-anchor A domain-containing protein